MHVLLQSIIGFYGCSNLSRTVGGTVSSLAIGPKGYVL
jgi:hypothetical protein